MIAISSFLTALECTKFVFGRGSARTALGSLQRSPDPLAGLRGPTSKGKDREGERREEEGRKWNGMERGKKGRGGLWPPNANSWIRRRPPAQQLAEEADERLFRGVGYSEHHAASSVKASRQKAATGATKSPPTACAT